MPQSFFLVKVGPPNNYRAAFVGRFDNYVVAFTKIFKCRPLFRGKVGKFSVAIEFKFVNADDTTIYCIGESVDSVTNTLNNALKELEDWSSKNNLVPHPEKCEAMILLRGSFTGPLNALTLCNHTIKSVTYARLLSVTIDDKLKWAQHISEVKKSLVNKLNLLKLSSFLPRNILLDLYFKIILPSVSYALPIWGSFTNKDGFLALESLHCRAAKLIYGLTRDMPTTEVLKVVLRPKKKFCFSFGF